MTSGKKREGEAGLDAQDVGSLLENLGDEAPDPVLPFRREDVPHDPAGPGGYRNRADAARWLLTLNSGRTIRLDSLRQNGTYSGVLAGSPRTEGFNDRIVKNAIERAAGELGCELSKIAVLPPRMIRSLERKRPEDLGHEEIAVDYLPPVRSLAIFESTPVRDSDSHWSSAAVLWFQERYGLPEEGHVIEKLRELDWERVAHDCSW
jgi:hypothetical protein